MTGMGDSVFEVGLKYVGRVSWFKSESPRSLSLGTRVEVVCEGALQGRGPGSIIAEAHNHDMTNTGVGKSGCVAEH